MISANPEWQPYSVSAYPDGGLADAKRACETMNKTDTTKEAGKFYYEGGRYVVLPYLGNHGRVDSIKFAEEEYEKLAGEV